MPPPRVPVDQLVDRAGAAEILGCHPDHISARLSKRPEFPEPVLPGEPGRNSYWDRRAIVAFRDGRMPPADAPPLLVDRAGVAKILGVNPDAVSHYVTRYEDFPAPVLPGWYHPKDIRDWMASRPGRTGRPRKDAPS